MRVLMNDNWQVGPVRIRASAPDPLEGARGHEYIARRQLGAPVRRLDNKANYRCRLVVNGQATTDDYALDACITVKATTAIEAKRFAHMVSGCTVIDVERQDAVNDPSPV